MSQTLEDLRYGIIGSLATLEFVRARWGEIEKQSLAGYRKTVEPDVALFEQAVRADERQQLLATAVIQFPMGAGKYAMMRVGDLTPKEAPAPAIARLAEIIADAILPQDPPVKIITRAGTAPTDEQPEDEDVLYAGLDATETEGEL